MPTTTRSFFETHKKRLKKIIEQKNTFEIQGSLYNQRDPIYASLESGITRHRLRDYQLEALYILDYLFAQSLIRHNPGLSIDPVVAELLELVDKEKNIHSPFFGFEMATGSGKTMLMGACIYLLSKKYNVKNFLIITPSSTDIYTKTIRNFTAGNYDSIWAEDTPFTFNLVTGDDYSGSTLLFDHSRDANIFIFNISKFEKNATKTEKPWENAPWKDEHGNIISIKKYFEKEQLVIITDEAHHAQTKIANTIISKFLPESVLEFTATAIEDSDAKRNQTIVYKYDIKRYLEDGYGKLVRAFAVQNEDVKSRDDNTLSDAEKYKLITLLLVHLMKKEAVTLDHQIRGLKPIAFVKVKNSTPYAQKVYDYLKTEIGNDIQNISIIIEKINAQEFEITTLLKDFISRYYQNNLEKLRKTLAESAQKSIFYHGKSDKITKQQFENIKRNEVEIVVYMQKLDEGIDLSNIYTMAVINDTVSEFKTSVKQIIGRGVRLPKNTREFDDDSDQLKIQAEKLHIICDQGKNFEEVIMSIQQEFGLTDKYLDIDKKKVTITNTANTPLLEGKYIPRLKAGLKVKKDVGLLDIVSNVWKVCEDFVSNNCFEIDNKHFIRYIPKSFFLEVDVFTNSDDFKSVIQQAGGSDEYLYITKDDARKIYGMVQKQLYCLPDNEEYFKYFINYVDIFNDIRINFRKVDDSDESLAKNKFLTAFAFFYRNYVEKNYFDLSFESYDNEFGEQWSLKNSFKDYDIIIPESETKNKTLQEVSDRKKMGDMINNGYYFFGYPHSIYDYVRFDSFTEKQLADYAENVIQSKDTTTPFWIRNEKNIFFEYGTRKYYPDFILFFNNTMYVIEAKGEIYSDTKKNILLKKLDDIPGYKSLLVFSKFLDSFDPTNVNFEEFIKEAEEHLHRIQSTSELLGIPPRGSEFTEYLPVYAPQKALKKFVQNNPELSPDGWLRVETGEYPRTIYAVQVKGLALLPNHKDGEWLLLDSRFSNEEVEGKIVLIHHKDIEDEYEGHFTLRELHIEQVKRGLLPETQVVLKGTNMSIENIVLEDLFSEDDFKIIGIVR